MVMLVACVRIVWSQSYRYELASLLALEPRQETNSRSWEFLGLLPDKGPLSLGQVPSLSKTEID